jgi:hypothetical protein
VGVVVVDGWVGVCVGGCGCGGGGSGSGGLTKKWQAKPSLASCSHSCPHSHLSLHPGNRVNEPLMIERDGTVHRLGHYYTGNAANHAAKELHRFVFGRGNPQYVPSVDTFVNPAGLPRPCCECCHMRAR